MNTPFSRPDLSRFIQEGTNATVNALTATESVNGYGMSVGAGGIASQGSILTQGSIMFSDGSQQTTAATGISAAPVFSAHRSGTLAGVAGASFEYNAVTVGSSDFDGEYYTVPKSGLYQFNWENYGIPVALQADAQIMVTPISGASEFGIVYRLGYKPTIGGYADGGISFAYRLVAGDKVRVISPKGWQMWNGGSPYANWFNGFYISP